MKLKSIDKEFIHRQSAHCESGSTSNLLLNYGIEASEPLVFGIGSGVFFGYFPFIKVQGMPTITFRNMPGRILKNTAKRLGVRFETFRFHDQEKAMDALDRVIDDGVPAGVRTGVFCSPICLMRCGFISMPILLSFMAEKAAIILLAIQFLIIPLSVPVRTL
jgi:hypothetical protein